MDGGAKEDATALFIQDKAQRPDALIIKGAQADPNHPYYQNLFFRNLNPNTLIIEEADARYGPFSIPHKIHKPDQIPKPLDIPFGYGECLFLSKGNSILKPE